MPHPYSKMNKITITTAEPKDAEAIMRIKREGWVYAYANTKLGITEEAITNSFGDFTNAVQNWRTGLAIKDPNRETFVAKKDGQVVGFVAPQIIKDKWRLGAMYVDKRYHNMGVGSLLIERAFEWLGDDKDFYIEVVSYNHNAINFYKKHGFVQTDEVIDDTPYGPDELAIPCINMVKRAKY